MSPDVYSRVRPVRQTHRRMASETGLGGTDPAPTPRLNALNVGNLLAYAFNIFTTFLIGQTHLVGKTNSEGEQLAPAPGCLIPPHGT